jgi:hypothetical protein
VTAPEPGAEQGRPSPDTLAGLLLAGLMPPVLARFDGTFVVAQYRHECSDLVWNPDAGRKGWYSQTIPLGSFCTRCGWAPDLPLPGLDAVVEQMQATMPWDDALVFAASLLGRVKEGRW